MLSVYRVAVWLPSWLLRVAAASLSLLRWPSARNKTDVWRHLIAVLGHTVAAPVAGIKIATGCVALLALVRSVAAVKTNVDR